MWQTLRQRPETVFVLVLIWKAALLLFTAQPVPANDSFFYDGPVVNLLLHGRYCNPALVNALPISGAEVFSAYPPLYQLLLLGWMKLAGTTVIATLWLHFLLFGAYAGLVQATLRKLHTPIWATHLAGAFLLGITFHDRPDSLAHVFGMTAVWATIQTFDARSVDGGRRQGNAWVWMAVMGSLLCLGTSLQIGGIYLLLVVGLILIQARLLTARLPRVAVLCLVISPAALLLGVKTACPQLWAGFLEHAHQTPSLTGWRWPTPAEVLKIIRSAPGVLLVLALLPLGVLPAACRQLCIRSPAGATTSLPAGVRSQVDPICLATLLSATLAALAVVLASLFILTANMVLIAAYLQPLVVGTCLGFLAITEPSRFKPPLLKLGFGLAILLTSIRAIGLSTLGVACALDVSERQAQARVARELAALPTHTAVGLSSAFLYDAWPQHGRLTLLHSDWLGPASKERPAPEFDALCAVQPARLILTQFDYYRRYQWMLARLQTTPERVNIRVENTARVHPPDASPRWQRVVQQVSWAPVIVTLEWSKPLE